MDDMSTKIHVGSEEKKDDDSKKPSQNNITN